MTNDLISREALKNELNRLRWTEENGFKYRFILDDIIDNTPTVELFCSYLSDGEVRQPCVESPCKYERQQGEWVEKIETKQLGHGWLTSHEIVCNICGGSGESDEGIPQCWKFCPNCGADMRGDEE